MEKLILEMPLALGDAVVFSALPREIHRSQPRRFLVDVRTNFPDVFRHNPFITQIADGDPDARRVRCNYPAVNKSNQRPYHFLYGFVEYLSKKLDIHLSLSEFRGDIHISEHEAKLPPRIEGDYWLIDNGGKSDFTAKWPVAEHMQAVVDELMGSHQFAQIGTRNEGDHHPRLCNVIDLTGQREGAVYSGGTTVRELILLMLHAKGVVTPVSAPMHLAAAVPTKDGSLRPCVVIAGGREPAHWEQYPAHTWLGGVGQLPCSASGACWKGRTEPLPNVGPDDSCCTNTVKLEGIERVYPRCIARISVDDIKRAILSYEV